MRKVKASKLLLLVLVFVLMAFIATGCVSVEIKLNKNGSGEAIYTIQAGGMMSLDDVEDEIKKSIEESNEEAGKDVVTLKDISEDDGKIKAELKFKDISALSDDDSIKFMSFKDFYKENDDLLDEGIKASNEEEVEMADVKKSSKLKILYMESSEGDEMITSMKITVPGKIVYYSPGSKLIDKKTVDFRRGGGFVVYEGSGSILPWIIAVIVVVVLAFVFLGGKKKKNSDFQV